jgi:hypothetical protein
MARPALSAGLALALCSALLTSTDALRPVKEESLREGAEAARGLTYEHRTMPELVLGKGYPLEEHFVTTADGYVLGVYRIPHGKEEHARASRCAWRAAH